MQYTIISNVVILLSAIISTFGILRIGKPIIKKLRSEIVTERRHRKRMRDQRNRQLGREESENLLLKWLQMQQNKWLRHFDIMLRSVRENYDESTLTTFLLFNLALYTIVGVITIVATNSMIFGITVAFILSIINYLRYRLKYRQVQIQGGYDLSEVTGIIVSKYRIADRNMRTALTLSSKEITSPVIRKMFLNIVRIDQKYSDIAVLQDAVDEIGIVIGTSFAKQLSVTILKGLVRKSDVEKTLLNIDKNIQKNIEELKNDKDSKTDILILSRFHPFAFPITLFVIVPFAMFGTGTSESFSHIFEFQFGSSSGRFMFTASVVSIIASYFLASWFRKPPNDY